MAHSKTTSRRVASKASKLLRTSKSNAVKSVSGSALTQKHKKGVTVSGKPPLRP